MDAQGEAVTLTESIYVYWVPSAASLLKEAAPAPRRRCGVCRPCINPQGKRRCTGRPASPLPVVAKPGLAKLRENIWNREAAKEQRQRQGTGEAPGEPSEQWEKYAVHPHPQPEVISTRASPGSLKQFMAAVASELSKDPLLQELESKAALVPGPVQHRAFRWIGAHLWRTSNGYYQLVVPAGGGD